MRDSLNNALGYLGMEKGHEHGLYAPLVRRFPLRIDDACPQAVKDGLEANNTCACTDSEVVYVDTSKAKGMFERAKEVASEGEASTVSPYDAKYNFVTVLAHEYTHILMQHVDKGIKFVRANGDKNYPIFAFACDIEANRGYGIDKDSDIYKIAVTEDAYPECKGVVGLMNIYRTLKKHYGDDILKNYDDMKKNMEGVGGSEDEEPSSESSSEPSSESSSSSSSASNEKDLKEQALADAVKSMEQMREEIEKKASQMSEEEIEEGIGQFDENAEGSESDATAQVMSPGGTIDGYGATPGSTITANPADVLRAEHDRMLEAKLAKSIERVKSVVKGTSTRTRTPTYSRQSRKSSDDGLIRKGVKNGKSLAPRILVAMDSSGSMSSTQVTPIASAIGTIAKTMGKTRGSYICEHDAHVKNVLPLSRWEEVVKGYCPNGDNNFDRVLEKAIELKVEVVLNIGDGYARFYDVPVMQRAKGMGIKWIDVQVCGRESSLRDLIDEDKDRFGDKFIGREIIKCNVD